MYGVIIDALETAKLIGSQGLRLVRRLHWYQWILMKSLLICSAVESDWLAFRVKFPPNTNKK